MSSNNCSFQHAKSTCLGIVIKSLSDVKEYHALLLENGMKVLLASEPNCEKSAASISVAIGSMNDPPELPGLAHLCEHMLFFESPKPDSSEGYAKFISENGGSCNAFTTRDQTNYHFDVSSDILIDALTRFSKFFTEEPDFPETALQKEISVINSEHENKFLNDFWRKMSVEACTAKEHHPFRQFSTGNEETLWKIPNKTEINILDHLKIFHEKHYSANVMSLAVCGKESLLELEEIVVSLFSGVRNLDIPIPIWSEHPYECQKRIDIVPISDVRDLYICFPIPDTRPYYKTFPHGYLSSLLAHKGSGSLFGFLNRRNWVNNIYLNSSVPARGFGYFSIGLQLTIEGLDHIEEIVGHVFEYIQMLRNAGPQKYFWKEMCTILSIQFRFQDRENPIEMVQRTSNLMHVYNVTNVLSVGYIVTDFDESAIQKFTDCLIPENCRIMTIAKRNDSIAMLTEKWYGVKYNQTSIPQTQIETWRNPTCISDEFHLPVQNDLIPESFDLIRNKLDGECTPLKLHEDAFDIVWFLQDNDLFVPKAFIYLEIFSPLPMIDPVGFNLNHLMCTIIKESLIEEFYGATLSGLNYDIKGTMFGIEITINGFNEKISLLTKRIIEKVSCIQPVTTRFKGIKDVYENGLSNWKSQQPYVQVPYFLSLLLREKRFTHNELLESSKDLTLDMVKNFHKIFMSKLKLEWFIHGNLTESEALKVTKSCRETFKNNNTRSLSPCQTVRLREISLPSGSSYVYKTELVNHRSSCCAVFLQIGVRNLKENVLLELLDQIIYERCFNQLRNKENLGYIVRSSVRKSSGTQGLLIVVQGVQKPCYVQERIDALLANLKNVVSAISEEELGKHKAAVSLRKKDASKNRSVRVRRLWNEEIYTREYNFNRLNEELSDLSKVTISEVALFFNTYIEPTSNERKCLSLHLSLPEEVDDVLERKEIKTNHINNITDWKTQMGLNPLFKKNPYFNS